MPEDGDGPPDPRLDPRRSMGVDPEDVSVSRDDVALGSGSPADFTAADTGPLSGHSVAELVAVLGADAAPDRRRAALALAEREAVDDRALSSLEAHAREDPDAEVRQFAVEALGNLAEDTPAAVVDALADENPWVRAEAVVALDHLDATDREESLEAALTDDHHAVRRNAAIALWKSRGDGAVPALLDLADDESSRVREWIAELLGDVEDPAAERALRTLADDTDSIVAETAATALTQGDDRQPRGTGTVTPDGPGDRPPEL